MKPKYLRHRKTGAIFPFSDHLLKVNRNMEPFHGKETIDSDNYEAGKNGFTISNDGVAQINQLDAPPAATASEVTAGDETKEPLMIGETPIEEATKDELVEFAKTAFGSKLDKRKSESELRQMVAALMQA